MSNILSEYRKRRYQEEKEYINGLAKFRYIDVSNYQQSLPYVKTKNDIYFCNQKVDKCSIINFRKTYNKLKSMSKCGDYKDKFRKIYDCDKQQTLLFLDKPNLQVYIGYSKSHGVYFNLKSPALRDDIVLIDSSEYKEIKKCMSLKNTEKISMSLKKNIYNNTQRISNLTVCLENVINALECTLGSPRIPLIKK